ncbi:hypothetical protein ACQEVC_00690 [Plantactinospora sp. CA-294935]|uniref:hypothetical protein n=1 Tax=Plantactinospora sp. CA-294935 TaxID=3240012 RepID=UPI003D8BBAF2
MISLRAAAPRARVGGGPDGVGTGGVTSPPEPGRLDGAPAGPRQGGDDEEAQ